jgi:hypothetical protein
MLDQSKQPYQKRFSPKKIAKKDILQGKSTDFEGKVIEEGTNNSPVEDWPRSIEKNYFKVCSKDGYYSLRWKKELRPRNEFDSESYNQYVFAQVKKILRKAWIKELQRKNSDLQKHEIAIPEEIFEFLYKQLAQGGFLVRGPKLLQVNALKNGYLLTEARDSIYIDFNSPDSVTIIAQHTFKPHEIETGKLHMGFEVSSYHVCYDPQKEQVSVTTLSHSEFIGENLPDNIKELVAVREIKEEESRLQQRIDNLEECLSPLSYYQKLLAKKFTRENFIRFCNYLASTTEPIEESSLLLLKEKTIELKKKQESQSDDIALDEFIENIIERNQKLLELTDGKLEEISQNLLGEKSLTEEELKHRDLHLLSFTEFDEGGCRTRPNREFIEKISNQALFLLCYTYPQIAIDFEYSDKLLEFTEEQIEFLRANFAKKFQPSIVNPWEQILEPKVRHYYYCNLLKKKLTEENFISFCNFLASTNESVKESSLIFLEQAAKELGITQDSVEKEVLTLYQFKENIIQKLRGQVFVVDRSEFGREIVNVKKYETETNDIFLRKFAEKFVRHLAIKADDQEKIETLNKAVIKDAPRSLRAKTGDLKVKFEYDNFEQIFQQLQVNEDIKNYLRHFSYQGGITGAAEFLIFQHLDGLKIKINKKYKVEHEYLIKERGDGSVELDLITYLVPQDPQENIARQVLVQAKIVVTVLENAVNDSVFPNIAVTLYDFKTGFTDTILRESILQATAKKAIEKLLVGEDLLVNDQHAVDLILLPFTEFKNGECKLRELTSHEVNEILIEDKDKVNPMLFMLYYRYPEFTEHSKEFIDHLTVAQIAFLWNNFAAKFQIEGKENPWAQILVDKLSTCNEPIDKAFKLGWNDHESFINDPHNLTLFVSSDDGIYRLSQLIEKWKYDEIVFGKLNEIEQQVQELSKAQKIIKAANTALFDHITSLLEVINDKNSSYVLANLNWEYVLNRDTQSILRKISKNENLEEKEEKYIKLIKFYKDSGQLDLSKTHADILFLLAWNNYEDAKQILSTPETANKLSSDLLKELDRTYQKPFLDERVEEEANEEIDKEEKEKGADESEVENNKDLWEGYQGKHKLLVEFLKTNKLFMSEEKLSEEHFSIINQLENIANKDIHKFINRKIFDKNEPFSLLILQEWGKLHFILNILLKTEDEKLLTEKQRKSITAFSNQFLIVLEQSLFWGLISIGQAANIYLQTNYSAVEIKGFYSDRESFAQQITDIAKRVWEKGNAVAKEKLLMDMAKGEIQVDDPSFITKLLTQKGIVNKEPNSPAEIKPAIKVLAQYPAVIKNILAPSSIVGWWRNIRGNNLRKKLTAKDSTDLIGELIMKNDTDALSQIFHKRTWSEWFSRTKPDFSQLQTILSAEPTLLVSLITKIEIETLKAVLSINPSLKSLFSTGLLTSSPDKKKEYIHQNYAELVQIFQISNVTFAQFCAGIENSNLYLEIDQLLINPAGFAGEISEQMFTLLISQFPDKYLEEVILDNNCREKLQSSVKPGNADLLIDKISDGKLNTILENNQIDLSLLLISISQQASFEKLSSLLVKLADIAPGYLNAIVEDQVCRGKMQANMTSEIADLLIDNPSAGLNSALLISISQKASPIKLHCRLPTLNHDQLKSIVEDKECREKLQATMTLKTADRLAYMLAQKPDILENNDLDLSQLLAAIKRNASVEAAEAMELVLSNKYKNLQKPPSPSRSNNAIEGDELVSEEELVSMLEGSESKINSKLSRSYEKEHSLTSVRGQYNELGFLGYTSDQKGKEKLENKANSKKLEKDGIKTEQGSEVKLGYF